MSSIEEKVKRIIEEKLSVNPDQITLSAKFAEDLKADSLDTVELVMALEDEFGTTLNYFETAAGVDERRIDLLRGRLLA